MHVLAEDAAREFVGDGLADHGRAGIDQLLHYPGVVFGGPVSGQPVRVPASGHVTRDIENVLGRKREAGQWPAVGAGQVGVAIGNEGVQGAGHGYSISSFSVTPKPRSIGRGDIAVLRLRLVEPEHVPG